MRILNLIANLSGGGAERQLSYLAEELAKMGHDVHIGFIHEGNCAPEIPGVSFYKLNSQSHYSPLLLVEVVRLIRFLKPDIVQTWIFLMDFVGGLAAQITGIPWYLREPTTIYRYKGTFKEWLRRKIASKSTAVIANSSGGLEYWRNFYPQHEGFIVRNALPLKRINQADEFLPKELSNSKLPILLFVGRLEPLKRPGLFLQILAELNSHIQVQGIICGSGPMRNSIEEMKQEMNLEGLLFLTGSIHPESVWGLMKSASIYMSLSKWEGCPNAVMEAITCGCTTVVSDIPAHHEILDEEIAYYIDPENIQRVVEYLLSILSTESKIERSKRSKDYSKQWSIQKMALQYEEIYNCRK